VAGRDPGFDRVAWTLEESSCPSALLGRKSADVKVVGGPPYAWNVKSPEEQRLDLFLRQYNSAQIDQTYLLVYRREDMAPRAFASIHERLDACLNFLNAKAPNGHEGHYNADDSRDLLRLIDELNQLRRALRMVGQALVVRPEYERTLEGAAAWLQPSNGSSVPKGFTPVEVDPYAPMLWREETALAVSSGVNVELKMVGAGAFATVQKFVDPTYGITLARKKLKPEVGERERKRFRQEFELMKELRFPYILEVYRFNDVDGSYLMEYCDATLEQYVSRRNNQSGFSVAARKRIALQFLYGLNYIHSCGHVHRDLSITNVLLRVYTETAVLVKLSDFGLAKREGSEFTRTETELKGTKLDPALDRFKDFTAVNDIYSAGFILHFIFTGRKNLGGSSPVARIVRRCVAPAPSRRYQSVREIIAAVEGIDLPVPVVEDAKARESNAGPVDVQLSDLVNQPKAETPA
jgi:eukaryotic-like serine/threonine-protein kinase